MATSPGLGVRGGFLEEAGCAENGRIFRSWLARRTREYFRYLNSMCTAPGGERETWLVEIAEITLV